MSVSGSQNYKEVVQMALRAEKLANERGNKGKFQKRKGFGFMSGQYSKKSKSSESSGNSSGSGAESVSSPQAIRSPQPSRFGTSLSSTTSRGRAESERCPRCRQIHLGPCSAAQVCFQCGKTGHVKRFCPMSNTTASAGQTLGQPRALAVSSGRAAGRPLGSVKSTAGSSLGP